MSNPRPSSERVRGPEGRLYHIGFAPGEVAPFVLLVGDPERVARVRTQFDTVELERKNREYVGFTGSYRGLRITVLGTGIGPDNTEIAVVELSECAPHLTLLRCGTSGGLAPHLRLGDVVISLGAVRLENTSTFYVDEGFPAIAHPEVVLAAVQAASAAKVPHHVGLTATAPSFYGGQGRSLPGFPPRRPDLVADLVRQGVANLEMEASCLLTLATLRGHRAGVICAVFAERHTQTFIDPGAKEAAEAQVIAIALSTLANLAALDAERGDAVLWHPGLRPGERPAPPRDSAQGGGMVENMSRHNVDVDHLTITRPPGEPSLSLHDDVILIIHQAFGPTGESLIGISDVTFDGFPALTLLIRANGREGLVHLSPIHGDPRKAGFTDIPAGTRCELLCPISKQPLDKVGRVLPGEDVEYCAIYLTPKKSRGSAIYVSDVWGHYHSRIVEEGELISAWANKMPDDDSAPGS